MQKLSRKDNITLKAKKKRKNEKTNHHYNEIAPIADLNDIVFGGKRMGLYFLESGASFRNSNVVYDREGSSFAFLCSEISF